MSGEHAKRDDTPEPKAKIGARDQLLEAAGELFAEKGFDAVTGREISLKAGMNAAAINYHFGGIDNLYLACLTEARERMVSQRELFEVLASAETGEGRLRALLRYVVGLLFERGSTGWALRLLWREITAPSSVGRAHLLALVQPRIAMFRAIVSDITGLEPDDPVVGRCCISIMAPVQILMLSRPDMALSVYPELEQTPEGAEAMAEHLFRFAMAGVKASVEAARGE